MSYYEIAQKQFTENVNLVDRTSDALTWNLNGGLGNLTESLAIDLLAIKNQLANISRRLDQMESK